MKIKEEPRGIYRVTDRLPQEIFEVLGISTNIFSPQDVVLVAGSGLFLTLEKYISTIVKKVIAIDPSYALSSTSWRVIRDLDNRGGNYSATFIKDQTRGVSIDEFNSERLKDLPDNIQINPTRVPPFDLTDSSISVGIDFIGAGHYISPEEITLYIHEIARVLKEGGKYYIYPISNRKHYWDNALNLFPNDLEFEYRGNGVIISKSQEI